MKVLLFEIVLIKNYLITVLLVYYDNVNIVIAIESTIYVRVIYCVARLYSHGDGILKKVTIPLTLPSLCSLFSPNDKCRWPNT